MLRKHPLPPKGGDILGNTESNFGQTLVSAFNKLSLLIVCGDDLYKRLLTVFPKFAYL